MKLSRFYSDYAMVLVLLALVALFSALTWTEQADQSPAGIANLAGDVARLAPQGRFLTVVRDVPDDVAFAEAFERSLVNLGWTSAGIVRGHPADARAKLLELEQAATGLHAIGCTSETATWGVFDDLAGKHPRLGSPQVFAPRTYAWPTFLTVSNLLSIAHQISILAILAIGMTLVIIAGGIDLSVGSLMAFAAVLATLLIREYAGAQDAGPMAMGVCCLAAILASAAMGFGVGLVVTFADMPPFIATLGVMLIARGAAYVLSGSETINQVPPAIDWLDRGFSFGLPHITLLMLALYLAAHVLMTGTVLGRYIYVVGGNREAARLSGVPVARVLWFVYVLSAALAGLGGIALASRFQSGTPTYGQDYELHAIAAVVLGGTSLRGGEGNVFGTLLGVLIIAVIQSGMNMMKLIEMDSNWQRVVFGVVLLLAVVFDSLPQRRK